MAAPSAPAALFAYGFRPFFLATGLAAVVLVPWWASAFAFGTPLPGGWPPTLWHSHEMLYGFICAAIAGFLLTAVPSWTGERGFAGRPLMLLAGLWLLARLAVGTSQWWPLPVVAATDLAFLPVLAVFVAVPLLRARNRNTPLLLVLVVLWLADAAFYWELGRHDATRALSAVKFGIDVVLVLVTVIGGRIVPAFTSSGLRTQGVTATIAAWRGVTPLTVGLMVACAAADALAPDGRLNGWLALAAALAQAIRLLQWRSLHTLRVPLVWVLHLGYAWLPLGLGLKALAILNGAGVAAFWLHALTIGAAATMILAVMSRATLGHTGRPLVASPAITAGYLLLAGAAVVRVFGLVWWAGNYPAVIVVSALLWTAAFALFLIVYGPMLWSVRIDGRPG
ncbi:MAG: NnrS family protein [Proteobacteria bacterium]|nr:NnrS family protein [Pseudomonadota bacterium]